MAEDRKKIKKSSFAADDHQSVSFERPIKNLLFLGTDSGGGGYPVEKSVELPGGVHYSSKRESYLCIPFPSEPCSHPLSHLYEFTGFAIGGTGTRTPGSTQSRKIMS